MVAEALHANKLLHPAADGRKPGNFKSGNVPLTGYGIVESVRGAAFEYPPLCAFGHSSFSLQVHNANASFRGANLVSKMKC